MTVTGNAGGGDPDDNFPLSCVLPESLSLEEGMRRESMPTSQHIRQSFLSRRRQKIKILIICNRALPHCYPHYR
jgi:hypothetical protein